MSLRAISTKVSIQLQFHMSSKARLVFQVSVLSKSVFFDRKTAGKQQNNLLLQCCFLPTTSTKCCQTTKLEKNWKFQCFITITDLPTLTVLP